MDISLLKKTIDKENKKKAINKPIYSMNDFIDKYSLYDITIDYVKKEAVLRKPIDTKYMPIFIHDCHFVGLLAVCDGRWQERIANREVCLHM